MLDADSIRKDFPIFSENPGLVYLDSAATSQRPRQVISAVSDFYSKRNSNVARGLYRIAEETTLEYESVRQKVARFINAPSSGEIIFTKNTTEACNLVMRGFGEKFVKKGDRIVATVLEHHSNFVPWQHLAKTRKASFEVVGIGDDGMLDYNEMEAKLKGARIVAICTASNVAGTLNDVRKVASLIHELGADGAVCVADAAQSAPSMPTDVRRLGCDFLMFSGHKMLAPFGSGALWGREELLSKMDPFQYGSAMIRSVTVKDSEWAEIPQKFEAGTPIVDAVIGLGAAIDYLGRIGLPDIRRHEEELVSYMLKRLGEVKGLEVIGPADARKRAGLVAFTLKGVHPHDIAALLSEDGICVRSGHHCAMPLHGRLGIPASTRASVYLYNRLDEIDKLADSLQKIRKVFK